MAPLAVPAAVAAAVALALPLAGLGLLLAVPGFDVAWEHDPAHFWLVLAAAALSAVLAHSLGNAACRRGDPRVFLVSLGFLSASAFLGLHALATPGVLLSSGNAGFATATPVGLVIAAVAAAASGGDLTGRRGARVIARAGVLRGAVLAASVAWAALSLTRTWPLDGGPVGQGEGPLVVLAIPAVLLFAWAVARYVRVATRLRSGLVLALMSAFVLLAEASVAVAVGRSWHATWWEWHLLMLAAFALVARSAHREWHEERFAGLYVAEGSRESREVTVLFADLAGFTAFSEQHDPREVSEMLNAYFAVAIPSVMDRYGGEVDRIIGDELFVVFNRRGDRPEHARDGALAALALQRETGRVADGHPGWPRFRVGVNTGEVLLTVLGTRGGRTHTAVGDAINVAARLQAQAPVGGVAVGGGTAARLPADWTRPLGELSLKGRRERFPAYLLRPEVIDPEAAP
ncbi:MAG: adenylate/guanylate cyclase domain-containing protein [Thermoleophilia bacterium]|nr:adenylate/guanylate cyclase domain-containing protein [Thermoleophilia bacterium]